MPLPNRNQIKLFQFPISIYCEKARWALDYKNISYQQVNLAPGLHRPIIKWAAPSCKQPITVPVLVIENHALQGSDKIIDYLDQEHFQPLLGFNDETLHNQASELEGFLDLEVGVPLRAIFYHSLFNHNDKLAALWSDRAPLYAKAWVNLATPSLKYLIRRMYRTDSCFVPKHKERFTRALDRLDEIYQKKRFLVGDRFSRADLTAAAFLAPLKFPDEHLAPCPVSMPESFESFRKEHKARPAVKRVAELYRDYRRNASS